MPGPCSMPNGDKRRWEELNDIVCDTHFVCWPGRDDNYVRPGSKCVLITYREWLRRRNRLRTGKTL